MQTPRHTSHPRKVASRRFCWLFVGCFEYICVDCHVNLFCLSWCFYNTSISRNSIHIRCCKYHEKRQLLQWGMSKRRHKTMKIEYCSWVIWFWNISTKVCIHRESVLSLEKLHNRTMGMENAYCKSWAHLKGSTKLLVRHTLGFWWYSTELLD